MFDIFVNGQARRVGAEPETPLLWVLRDTLGMTGTKYGCGIAQCGACTVLVDGQAMRSYQVTLDSVGGGKIETIEAVDADVVGCKVVEAWVGKQVPQCGYCQSGQVMAAVALLRTTPKPGDADIADAMSNLCRCGTHNAIAAAVRQPELARVGLSEQEARAQGIAYRLASLPVAAILRTRTTGEPRGLLKALVGEDDRILGFTAVAPHAGEMLPVLQLAMQAKLSFKALESLVIAHPTYAEGIVGMFAGLSERQYRAHHSSSRAPAVGA